MLEGILNLLQKLLESYLELFNTISQQHKSFALLVFRISIIINSLQELQLIAQNSLPSDTKAFYQNIKQFIFTNQVVKNVSETTVLYLLIIHLISNSIIIIGLLFLRKKTFPNFILFLLILVENQILIYPTLYSIFQVTKNITTSFFYITSILNIIMYFQLFITKYTWRQTILLDIQGLIQNGGILLELLIQLVIILAVGFLRISRYGSFIFIILKQFIKLLVDINSFNHNNAFQIYQNVIQTIIIISLFFNFSMIYTLIIIAFCLQITFLIKQKIFQYYLFQFEISIQKCQIYELLFKQHEKTQKIKLLQLILQRSYSSNLNKQSRQLISKQPNQVQQLEKLILDSHYQDQSLIQIYCNYDIQQKPLKTVILFMKNYKVKNMYDQAYANVQQKLLNYIIIQTQQLMNNKFSSINIMDNQTFVNAFVLAENSLKEIEKVIQCKINLLEALRKGFIQQIDVLEQVELYTNSVYKCRSFVIKNYDLKEFKLRQCRNQDMLTLRILQFYFGVVLNDLKISKTLGKMIDDLLKADKALQDTTINNQFMIQNRFLLLQTSLINQRGKLINFNKKHISNFFQYQVEYLQDYQYIYEFMPDFIAQIHDDLIENFIDTGYSQLLKIGKTSFVLDPQNFLIPVNIHLYNPNFHNDFTMYSIITMQIQQQEYILFDTEGRILGISKKFFDYTKAHKNQKEEINVFDIVHRGSSILYYMPYVVNFILELKNNIENQASNSVNNIRSYWHYPDNHFECMTQTQTLINYSQRFQLENQQIHGQNIKLLDKNFQNSFINLVKQKQMNDYGENQIEVFFSLHTYFIKSYLYFLITIRDYKIADLTKTYTTNSLQQVQNPLNSFSTKFTQLDHMMSERQLTTDNGTVQDIKQFSTFQHTQILEKLFKDDDMSGRFVVDISQKNQINASHSQSKLPFLSSRMQLSQRQLLQSGFNSVRIVSPQFHLPSIDQKKKVEDSQLYELEEEMKELEYLESIRKLQIIPNEQEQPSGKQIDFHQYESNINDESLKISEKQNDTQIQILLQKQIQQGSQLQMIQEIVNFEGTMKMVNLGYILNIGLTIWVFIMIFVNSKVVDDEMQTYFTQISSSISYQSLLFYLGVPYTIYQQLYSNNQSIIDFSPALLLNTESKIPFIYAFSQIQQQPFQQEVCSKPQFYSDYFSDVASCTNYFIQFQTYMTIKLKDYIINQQIDYNSFKDDNFYKKESFYGCKKLVDILTNFIESFSQVKINEIFIILLLLNMFIIVSIFFGQFKLSKSKFILKQKFYSVLHRLSYNEIVELIARFSCFKISISENSWKLVSYYDLINYDDQTKEKINQNSHKKFSQMNEEKLQKRGDIYQMLAISGSFFCWSLFFILNFVLFYILFENFAPSFRIAQNFVAFKQKLDFSLVLGFWIKTDPLLGIHRNNTEQTDIIKEYFILTESLQELLDDISSELLQSTYLDESQMKTILDTLNSDLCPFYQYLFCYPEKLSSLPYYGSESFATLLVGGTTGFVAQIYKFTVSEFVVENNTLQYSKDLQQLQYQVNEQIFKNIYIQYIQDIQFTMYTLFSEFNNGNSLAGQKLLSYINYYQFGLGLTLIFLYNIIDFMRIRFSIQELKQLKYILLVLPEQKFDNQIIKQKITDISKYFF